MITFKEAPGFTKRVYDYLAEGEYIALQWALYLRPQAGSMVPGSGGVRKLRWGAKGKGKSGGIRVIYYWNSGADQMWMLTIYAKNEEQNIPAHVLRQIKEELESV